LKLSDEKTREFMTFIEVSILLNNVDIILSEKNEELIKNRLSDKRTNEFDKNVRDGIENIQFKERV
jgi:hypothetical protein